MGRLMAKLLHRLEITKTDTLVEVQRGDLVATHIGQTAPKTRERIDEAKEGLLFVDEAYRLSGGGEKDFGKEAIEELMSAMLHPPGKAPVRPFARTILWLGCSSQTLLDPAETTSGDSQSSEESPETTSGDSRCQDFLDS